MPTPTGARSVADSLDAGMPYVTKSGISRELFHRRTCNAVMRVYRSDPMCNCGVNGAINGLAHAFDKALEEFGTPG